MELKLQFSSLIFVSIFLCQIVLERNCAVVIDIFSQYMASPFPVLPGDKDDCGTFHNAVKDH